MTRHTIGPATILADASGCWLVVRRLTTTDHYPARTREELMRARSVLLDAIKPDERWEAAERLHAAWEAHVRWAAKACEERMSEHDVEAVSA